LLDILQRPSRRASSRSTTVMLTSPLPSGSVQATHWNGLNARSVIRRASLIRSGVCMGHVSLCDTQNTCSQARWHWSYIAVDVPRGLASHMRVRKNLTAFAISQRYKLDAQVAEGRSGKLNLCKCWGNELRVTWDDEQGA